MSCYAAYVETAIVDSETAVVAVAENTAFGAVQVPRIKTCLCYDNIKADH